MRRAAAVPVAVYGFGVLAHVFMHRDVALLLPAALLLMIAAAVAAGRAARFLRDWILVAIGLVVYTLGGKYIEHFRLGTHYKGQIDAERWLFGGNVPTIWLQHHLFHGRVGPLEVYALCAYVSHFVAPLMFGFYLWWTRRRFAFRDLMLTLICVSLVAEVVYVVAPTAPPWLASQHGFLPPVHHLLKFDLRELGFAGGSSHIGNSNAYDIVAALPSLHIAWPTVGLLMCRRYRVSRVVTTLMAVQLFSVLFAIVYDGDHYVVDALGGAVLAFVVVAVRPTLAEALRNLLRLPSAPPTVPAMEFSDRRRDPYPALTAAPAEVSEL